MPEGVEWLLPVLDRLADERGVTFALRESSANLGLELVVDKAERFEETESDGVLWVEASFGVRGVLAVREDARVGRRVLPLLPAALNLSGSGMVREDVGGAEENRSTGCQEERRAHWTYSTVFGGGGRGLGGGRLVVVLVLLGGPEVGTERRMR